MRNNKSRWNNPKYRTSLKEKCYKLLRDHGFSPKSDDLYSSLRTALMRVQQDADISVLHKAATARLASSVCSDLIPEAAVYIRGFIRDNVMRLREVTEMPLLAKEYPIRMERFKEAYIRRAKRILASDDGVVCSKGIYFISDYPTKLDEKGVSLYV